MDPTFATQDHPHFPYYHVDPTSQYRQPAQFHPIHPHPHPHPHPSEFQPYYTHIQPFSPPSSQNQQQQQCMSGSQPFYSTTHPAHLNMTPSSMATSSNAYRTGMTNLTPMASPQSSQLKPAIVVQDSHAPPMSLDMRFVAPDFYAFSSPPPLSTPGSTISSPPSSSDAIHTPVHEGFFNFEKFEGVKEGCEGEVHSEILANADWSRSGTPPMTPVYIHPNPVTTNQPSELLSTHGSCPSLSPSPSPVASNLVSQSQSPLPIEQSGSDFCDPRQLTVESSLSTAAAPADLPPLPNISGDEVTLPVNETTSPSFTTSTGDPFSTLPTFDGFSDLDSNEDFTRFEYSLPPSGDGTEQYTNENILHSSSTDNNNSNTVAAGSPYSIVEDDGFLSETGLEDLDDQKPFFQSGLSLSDVPDAATNVPYNNVEEPCGDPESKKRGSSRKSTKKPSTAAEGDSNDQTSDSTTTEHPQNNGVDQTKQSSSSDTNTSGSPSAVSVARRGRKQSLTDDPSKTFVCSLCSRRFRRQEHLKRHYRSLHTQDKPFECNECGKKFSRSDNLAQHARTHSAGSLLMGVIGSTGDVGGLQTNPNVYQESVAGTNAFGAALYGTTNSATKKSSNVSLEGVSTDRRPTKRRRRDDAA